MHKSILDATIASVRRRDAQGDRPTEPAFSVEHLEGALLSLALETGYDERDPGPILSGAEKQTQAVRCACRGSDDYCPCQNVPDQTTRDERAVQAIIDTPDDVILAQAQPGDEERVQAAFEKARAAVLLRAALEGKADG